MTKQKVYSHILHVEVKIWLAAQGAGTPPPRKLKQSFVMSSVSQWVVGTTACRDSYFQ